MAHLKIGLIPAMAGAIEAGGDYVADYVRTAEASGFDSVWVGEHPALPVTSTQEYPGRREGLSAPSAAPLPDPIDWLAFAAAHTTDLLLGTAVLILPLHHPVVLAKRLATVDQLSGGRVRLGIGVGWNQQEYVACGARWEGRGRRADESIEAMRVLWRDDEAGYAGETVAFEPVYSSPKPVRRSIPIHVGTHSDAGARRAGRLGDGFLPFDRDRDQLNARIAVMKRAAEAAGRDPESVEITVMGSTRPEQVRLLAALGVTRMVLFVADLDRLPELGRQLNDVVADA